MTECPLFQVLLVEDSPVAAKLAQFWLADALPTPFELHKAVRLDECLRILRSAAIDLIVLDLNLPDSSGLDTFRCVHDRAQGKAIVVLSGDADLESAVEAVRLGAQDYVVKSMDGSNPLSRPVRFALERVRRQQAEAAVRANEQQLVIARSIQQHLFPRTAPESPGLEVAGRCEPADMIGGDYYDYLRFANGALGLVVADVSGHGLPAALLMCETRAVLRSVARTYDELGFVFDLAHEIMTHDLRDLFVAVFAASIDPSTRRLHFVSAGHRASLLRADGRVELLSSGHPPLGVHEGSFGPSRQVDLDSGDVLAMFTDGLVERFNSVGEQFGTSRLLQLVRAMRSQPATSIVNGVFDATKEFAAGLRQPDDNTLIIVKVA